MTTLELDCRGMPCPRPVIELARALSTVDIGDAVAVASDDVAAATDIAAFCRMRGQQYDGHCPADDGVPVHRVVRVS